MRKINKLLFVLLTLSLTLVPLVQADGPAHLAEAKKGAGVVKKYPPYPDVWDWVTPYPTRMSYRFQAEVQPDGDVQLSYELKSKSPKPTEDVLPRGEEYSFLFFSKRSVPPPKDFPAPHKKWRVILPNGKIIMSSGADRGGGNCFRLFERDFTARDHEENELARKTLLFVLDRPETFVPNGMCEGEPYDRPAFSYRMTTMLADLIPLEDSTFLVVDYEHGIVIRFDERWQSKSLLLNRRIFVMDRQELQAFIRNRKSLTTDEKDHGLPRPPVDEDLYQYLMTFKEDK